VAVVARRAPGVALLCALDRAPATGRWHVHALALLPPDLDVAKLLDWWRRLWPRTRPRGRHVRPARGAQRARFLAGGGADLANDLDRVLSHHLGRTRKGVPIPGLPALPDRVVACGALAGVWTRVCRSKGIPVGPHVTAKRKARSRRKKASTVASRPPRRWTFGESCAWCAGTFSTGKRKKSRYCDRCCRSAASRALRSFERRTQGNGPTARALVLGLEQKGWLRRDAIQAVTAAFAQAVAKGVNVSAVKMHAPVCRCGRPLGWRAHAVTCGRPACRMRLLRRRRRDERRAARVRALFTELLRLHRWSPFTRDTARALGTTLRARARDVDELLRQLADEDGAVLVLGGPNSFAFPPPRARRAAA
jgi:hypothetical protein